MQNWQIPHRISQLSNAVQVQGRGNRESPRNPHQYPGFSFRFLHLLPDVQDEIEALLKGLGFPLNFRLGAKKRIVGDEVSSVTVGVFRQTDADILVLYIPQSHIFPLATCCTTFHYMPRILLLPAAIAVRSSIVLSSSYCWWGCWGMYLLST